MSRCKYCFAAGGPEFPSGYGCTKTGTLAVSAITQPISDKLKELNECMEAME